jgi:hypothetical protein
MVIRERDTHREKEREREKRAQSLLTPVNPSYSGGLDWEYRSSKSPGQKIHKTPSQPIKKEAW